jgi:membrane fusion protein, copper/silver efflux system
MIWTLLMLLSSCGEPAPLSTAPTADPHAGHAAAPKDDMAGMDMGGPGSVVPQVVEVSAHAVEALGIRSVPVQSGSEGVARRAPATVGWDPHLLVRLTSQTGGQVRELDLPRPGETIEKGDVVARLYQPEVKAAFEELLVAKGLGEPWLGAARSRLQASGIGAGEIEGALKSGKAPDTFTVRAPVKGVVVQHTATEGTWIASGGVLGMLGDPHALVVDMVVSGQPPATGTEVTLRDPSGSETWTADVGSTLPTADAAGTGVRILPREPPPVGRPLIAEWLEPAQKGLWVPSTALIDTGERKVVFVEQSVGRYEPRAVEVGIRADDRVQIVAGLEGDEKVVVSAAFLLDSETQIGAMGHAGHGH